MNGGSGDRSDTCRRLEYSQKLRYCDIEYHKMQRRRQGGCITRHRGWGVVRFRQQVFVDGQGETVIRNRRLVPVDAQHKTKASVRNLAAEILEPLNRSVISPSRVMTVGDFVEGVYLPFAEQQKRPSTYRGYKQIWCDYLKCTSAAA